MSKSTYLLALSLFIFESVKGVSFAEVNPFGFGKGSRSSSNSLKTAQPPLSAKFAAEGVPAAAVQRVIQYLDQVQATPVAVTRKNRKTGKLESAEVMVATRFAGIIDYSKPSSQKRFYLLNLRTGETKKYYVSHGQNSGVHHATVFSNQNNSLKSSLGMVLTGTTYSGFHGKSMNLSGLEPSTEAVAKRDIVLHGADYASEDFLKRHGRLGRSWGCTTLDKTSAREVMEALGEGSVLYMYHPKLQKQMIETPEHQVLKDSSIVEMPDVVLPGEEQDLQEKRTR